MYYSPSENNPPHFHAYYQETKAIVDINNCEIISSNMKSKHNKLLTAWAELHKDELKANWELVMNGEEPYKINPLK